MQNYDNLKPKGFEKLRGYKITKGDKIMSQKLTLVTVGDKPNVELGIEEVKKLVKAIKELEEARLIVMEDGKVTLSDFLNHPVEVVWEPAKAIFDVVKSKDLLLAQIVQIDASEADEIIQTVANEFGMLPEKVIEKIGHALKAAWHIGEILK